jgi:hypothetical protein
MSAVLNAFRSAQRLYDAMEPDDDEDPTADAASDLRKCLDEWQRAYANDPRNYERLYELAASMRADAEQIEHAMQFEWSQEP